MAEINWYVDPDATGAGDGTSWTDAYTSLNAFEASEQTDLVSDGNNYVVNCRASSGTADTLRLFVNGWTTGISNGIKILGDWDTGVWDTSKYRFDITLNTSQFRQTSTISESYVTYEKLQFKHNNSSTGAIICIDCDPGTNTSDIFIKKCFVVVVAPDSSKTGIELNHTCSVENSIFCDLSTGILSTGFDAATQSIINCTICNCSSNGINRGSNNSVSVLNCAVFNNGNDFNGTFSSIDFCASDDGDGTNATTITQTASDYAALVTDAPNGDFSVTDASSELYNAGTNTGAPATDIIGTSRPQSTTVDIGAFELIVAVGGEVVQINIGDDWKDYVGMQINIGDDWKTVVSVKQNIGDDWKDVF